MVSDLPRFSFDTITVVPIILISPTSHISLLIVSDFPTIVVGNTILIAVEVPHPPSYCFNFAVCLTALSSGKLFNSG